MTQEQIIAVGRALLPYLRNDLTDVELGTAAHDAAAAVNSTALGTERRAIAAKAREWAEHYTPGSDGRNTFVLFAEWVESRAA